VAASESSRVWKFFGCHSWPSVLDHRDLRIRLGLRPPAIVRRCDGRRGIDRRIRDHDDAIAGSIAADVDDIGGHRMVDTTGATASATGINFLVTCTTAPTTAVEAATSASAT
jgi:hypothetical protein